MHTHTVLPNSSCPVNNGCSDLCSLVNAVEVCACSRGYELAADGATCVGKSNGWEGNVVVQMKERTVCHPVILICRCG